MINSFIKKWKKIINFSNNFYCYKIYHLFFIVKLSDFDKSNYFENNQKKKNLDRIKNKYII